jgi:hypothetical protein
VVVGRRYEPKIMLDGIVTVIDAINFGGYDDKARSRFSESIDGNEDLT